MASNTSSGSTDDGSMITSGYLKGNYFQRQDDKDILQEFKSKLNWSPENCERILDIGCGPGDVTNDILFPIIKEQAKDFKLVGSDIDVNAIEQAKTNYPSIDFDILDIGSPLSPKWIEMSNTKPFTKIFSFYALHWVKDHDMVLKNTNQLLSNGGEALFAAVYDSPYFNIYVKISKKEKWGKYMHGIENLLPIKFSKWPNVTDTYARKAKEAGLEVESCQISIKEHEYIPYLCWRAVNPYLTRIFDPIEREEFIEELHEITMNSPEIMPNYPTAWTKLLIVHLKKP